MERSQNTRRRQNKEEKEAIIAEALHWGFDIVKPTGNQIRKYSAKAHEHKAEQRSSPGLDWKQRPRPNQAQPKICHIPY
jgi:hypothetical protein